MSIFHTTDNLPEFRKPVITIGTFDGVHQGHKTILAKLVEYAQQVNGESIVITFEPHPRKLLFPEQSLRLLTPLKEKLQFISETGIKHIVVAPFTKAFSQLSAEDYVAHFLVKNFKPERIVIGYDHHFGHDRTGNIHMLQQSENEFGYKVIEIPAQLIDEAAVSSTKIRNALQDGNMEDAAHMLGRHYSLKGKVMEGKKLGRTIGYPTANIEPDDFDQLIPKNGVYAVKVRWKEQLFGGMLNIGFNPTVTDERKLLIEVNIFNFNESVYGQTLELIFIKWLRPEVKYNSLDALTLQLTKDKEDTLHALANC
ncbi:MAG TPA: bifunctional riboflavin kinase/FAD synthetase [Flavipsychrobacter sp.]|nr:bifunctional riboflavin kinase/FAD synthetase [Flavipsychrobacter sp.]